MYALESSSESSPLSKRLPRGRGIKGLGHINSGDDAPSEIFRPIENVDYNWESSFSGPSSDHRSSPAQLFGPRGAEAKQSHVSDNVRPPADGSSHKSPARQLSRNSNQQQWLPRLSPLSTKSLSQLALMWSRRLPNANAHAWHYCAPRVCGPSSRSAAPPSMRTSPSRKGPRAVSAFVSMRTTR